MPEDRVTLWQEHVFQIFGVQRWNQQRAYRSCGRRRKGFNGRTKSRHFGLFDSKTQSWAIWLCWNNANKSVWQYSSIPRSVYEPSMSLHVQPCIKECSSRSSLLTWSLSAMLVATSAWVPTGLMHIQSNCTLPKQVPHWISVLMFRLPVNSSWGNVSAFHQVLSLIYSQNNGEFMNTFLLCSIPQVQKP